MDSSRSLTAVAGSERSFFMNFPVEENAVDMSTRQIGWEKRKRVKEATTVTAATAKRGVLASSWI